jgi:arsenite-transporting ATPase
METNTTGTSCLGPLAGLQAQQRIYRKTVQALSDQSATTLVLVTRPEASALMEATRTSVELRNLGVKNQQLVINGVFTSKITTDPIAKALEARGQAALASIPEEIAELDRTTVPLAGTALLGVEALRRFGKLPETSVSIPADADIDRPLPAGLDSLMDDLAGNGHGVILVMGKGGVGKTTIASAVAVALAERGLHVQLSTTDPAAHLATTLAADDLSGLTVGRIDPAKETADYTAEVMQTAGANLDAAGKALLEEDLRSPCTEEIAVFRAFAKAVSHASDCLVVLDTAPTGHTILLLDSALAYHREVTRQASHMPDSVRQLLPRLRDPSFTRVLIVTLPEATPVNEAQQLQRDLRRAEIEPFAGIINQSLAPLDVLDPLLQQRRQQELPFIAQVQSSLASRTALIPWQSESPTGLAGLRRVFAPVAKTAI